MNKIRIVALVVFIASFALYMATLSPVAFPIDSAFSIASHMGWVPFSPFDFPLWGMMVRLLSEVGEGGSLAVRVHLLSAAFAAASAALIFWVCFQITHDRSDDEKRSRLDPIRVQLLSGLCASLFFVVSPSVWIAATRGYAATFGVFLLLLTLSIFIVSFQTRKTWALYVGSFLMGLGSAEYATFFIFMPLFGIYALAYTQRRRARFDWPVLLRIMAVFLLGYSLIFYAAWSVLRSPSSEWRGISTFGDALLAAFKQQKLAVSRAIPRTGWLVIFLSCYTPLLVVLFRKTRMQRGSRWPSYVLHITLIFICLLVLFPSPFSPYGMSSMWPLLVSPYVVAAIGFGYLAGYGWNVLSIKSRLSSGLGHGLRTAGFYGFIPLLLLIFGAAGWVNYTYGDGRKDRWVKDWVDNVLLGLEPDTIFLTNSTVGWSVLVENRSKGGTADVVNSSMANMPVYLRYLATLFEEPRIKGLASVGMGPAFEAWLLGDPEAPRRFLTDSHDNLFVVASQPHLPTPYFSRLGGNDTHVAAITQALEFWESESVRSYIPSIKETAPLYGLAQGFLLRQSRVANNLGVLAWENNDVDRASLGFAQALSLYPQNASAILNQMELLSVHPVADREGVQKAYAELLERADTFGGMNLWRLAHVFGTVHKPEAYVQRGLSWAVTGKANVGAQDMQRALQMAAGNERLRNALVMMCLMGDGDESSEEVYISVLRETPEHLASLIGMARLSASRGNLDEADGYMQRARLVAPDENSLILPEVGLAVLAGNSARAFSILDETLKKRDHDINIWTAMALIAMEVTDSERFDKAASFLRKRDDLPVITRLMFAHHAVRNRQWEDARRLLDRLLDRFPNQPDALDLLLRTHVHLGDRIRAEQTVRSILSINVQHPFANFVLGTLQYADRKIVEAEASFRASLAVQRLPETLNSLAFVLQFRGKPTEALALVEEALAIDPRSAATWDTYAMTLLGLGRLEQALEASMKAAEIAPENMEIQYHLARSHTANGNHREALRIADNLFAHLARFPAHIQTELQDFRGSVRRRIAAAP